MVRPANDRIKTVFQSALDRETPAAREAFLNEVCGRDAALRQRVEALLNAHEKSNSLLDHSAAEILDAEADDLEGLHDWLSFLAPPSKQGSLGRLGHYEVLDIAGRGGMGIVFRAFDDKLQRVVAIKALAPALLANPVARQQFVREARAAAAVNHDNVIAIHGVEEADPIPYLVMQFIRGISLQEKIERSGPLPLDVVLRIGLHIAEGLAAAHRQGLVHRDVKPANILLENGVERVKITDFGLAFAGDDPHVAAISMAAGTPTYMSPEQALGHPVDTGSDLFSLGSVLYAMCTGQAPFVAPTTLAVLKRVCEDTPRPIREINPECPAWLEELCSRLHAKASADRMASAREVADLLARRLAELQDRGATNPPPSTIPQTPAPVQRRRSVLLALSLLGLVGVFTLTEATGVTGVRVALARILGGDGRIQDKSVSSALGSHPLQALPKPPTQPAESMEARWEHMVAGLPAEEQAKAVAARLKSLNPVFDGEFTYKAADNIVYEYKFSAEYVSDITPLRVLSGLNRLECSGSEAHRSLLADLSPLAGMPLSALVCQNTRISNLSPLAGVKLTALDCNHSLVSDLSVLKGMPLTYLVVSKSYVSDLSPLRGMRLRLFLVECTTVSDISPLEGMPINYLGLYRTQVGDLSPLKGMPLEYLNLSAIPTSDLSALKDMRTLRRLVLDEMPVSDLSPLRNLSLTDLDIHNTQVTDLTALKDLPLKKISLSYVAERHGQVLRSLTGLKTINQRPADEFWKAQDK